MNFIYEFIYYKKNVEYKLLCTNEKSAINLFTLLVNLSIPFAVNTLKEHNYEKNITR